MARTEFDAALDLLVNWHPLLPPPIVLVTVNKLRRMLPAFLSSGISFNTILVGQMDDPFRNSALGAVYRLLPRAKCFLFMIGEGGARIDQYINPRQMMSVIGKVDYIMMTMSSTTILIATVSQQRLTWIVLHHHTCQRIRHVTKLVKLMIQARVGRVNNQANTKRTVTSPSQIQTEMKTLILTM